MSQYHVLIVEDDNDLRDAIDETLKMAGYITCHAVNGKDALLKFSSHSFDLIVTDIQMGELDGYSLLRRIRKTNSDIPIIMMTAYATIDQAIDAIRLGASEYLVKPFTAEILLGMIDRNLQLAMKSIGVDIVLHDERTKKIFSLASRVAKSDVTILIHGESGTGKEVLAKFIHNNSARKEEKFLAINCAAIPENMLEAELFGYEKGAFTGAQQRYHGKFEQAQGGILLLDEISEMNINLQAKLLRILQEREIQRLGGQETIKLDVRVIATTNRDLKEEVKQNRFREDLYYRLNVFPLTIEPLRNRKDDILPIATSMLKKYGYFAARNGHATFSFSRDATEKLLQHAWPGNVRELENVIQRALVICTQTEITEDDLCFELIQTGMQHVNAALMPSEHSLSNDVKNHEQKKILNVLMDCHGNRRSTAEKLGISQRTLRYKLSKMRARGVSIPFSRHALNIE